MKQLQNMFVNNNSKGSVSGILRFLIIGMTCNKGFRLLLGNEIGKRDFKK